MKLNLALQLGRRQFASEAKNNALRVNFERRKNPTLLEALIDFALQGVHGRRQYDACGEKSDHEEQDDLEFTGHPRLTLRGWVSLVKGMKMTEKTMRRIAQAILDGLKAQKVVQFKEKEDVVLERAAAIVKSDFIREAELDQEVNRMMDDLERQNPGGFQRYKMFPLLKKRLAKEKGIVL